jgi:hypothetical protein
MNGVELFIVSLIAIDLVTLLGLYLTICLGKQFWPEWLERHIMAPDPNPEPVRNGKW